jgi:WD40 repeat protein
LTVASHSNSRTFAMAIASAALGLVNAGIRPISTSLFCVLAYAVLSGLAWGADAEQRYPNVYGTQSADYVSQSELHLVYELERPGHNFAVAWDARGKQLATFTLDASRGNLTSAGGLLTVWNDDGKITQELRRDPPSFDVGDTFAFLAQDRQIAVPPSSASNNLAFSIFDIAARTVVQEVKGLHPEGRRNMNAASQLVSSPDQSLLAVTYSAAFNQPIAVYSTTDFSRPLALFAKPAGNGQSPDRVAFSSDGALLAISQRNNKIVIYDAVSREALQRIDPFPESFWPNSAVSFDPRSAMIAVGSSELTSVSRSPNGNVSIVSLKDAVRVFRIKDAARIASYNSLTNPVRTLVWSPDGNFIAIVDGNWHLHFWDPARPGLGQTPISLRPDATSLSFSPNGTRLAVANGNYISVFAIVQSPIR